MYANVGAEGWICRPCLSTGAVSLASVSALASLRNKDLRHMAGVGVRAGPIIQRAWLVYLARWSRSMILA